MQVLPLLTSDIGRIQHLQPEGWPPLQPYFEFYVRSSFCRPLKLVAGNQILAVGSCILHTDTAWVGHIIVDKHHRGQGLGSRMTEALIGIAQDMGRETIQLVATEMGAPLYRKLGFQDDITYRFLKGGQAVAPDADALNPCQGEYRSRVFQLDRLASGEERRLLLEPHLHEGWIIRNGAEVTGYYLPTLGEGLIVAKEVNAGLMLLRKKLQRDWPYLAIPEVNTPAIRFLEELGHRHYRSGLRMSLGPKRPWNPAMLFGRIGENLG
jgi:GNAT superfamily N-acetyltransferase